MFFQNFGDLSQIDLRSFSLHIVKIFPTLNTISLVGVPLEHELPDLGILLHELVDDLPVPVLFLVQVDEQNLFVDRVLELFGLYWCRLIA